MSLSTAGRPWEFWKESCSRRQSMLFFIGVGGGWGGFSALSSYDAVQGWMDKLRVHVGEAGKLALVDVGDDQLVGRGQHGLRARKKLVEVLCSFATL